MCLMDSIGLPVLIDTYKVTGSGAYLGEHGLFLENTGDVTAAPILNKLCHFNMVGKNVAIKRSLESYSELV